MLLFRQPNPLLLDLMKTIARGDEAAALLLLEKFDSVSNEYATLGETKYITPLHYAAKLGMKTLVDKLLEKNSPPSVLTRPLHDKCLPAWIHTPFSFAIKENVRCPHHPSHLIDILKRLIELDPQVLTFPDENGLYPLHHMVQDPRYNELLRYMCETSSEKRYGIFLEVKTEKEHDTPLHFAVRMGNEEIVRLLVSSYQANLYLKNIEGKTAAECATTPEMRACIQSLQEESIESSRKTFSCLII